MHGKIPALTLALSTLALTCLCPGTAQADVHLAFGTKWEPLRYTSALYPFASDKSTPGLVPSLSGFQSTSLDPYFAVFFAQKYGAVLGLDIGYGKVSAETPGAAMMATTTVDNSYLQFGFSLGFKYYILPPRREKVSPYLYVDFYKYFASISTNSPNISSDSAGQAAGLASPLGATFSFGAEYFVTPSFSVGSEIFGLKVAYSEADRPTNGGPYAGKDSYTYVTFYTGITLNYRFQIAASVSTSDEGDNEAEAQPRVKKKKVKPATDEEGTPTPAVPPPPPPPSPEAVD